MTLSRKLCRVRSSVPFRKVGFGLLPPKPSSPRSVRSSWATRQMLIDSSVGSETMFAIGCGSVGRNV
eukprot:4174019-Pyramimonas_sp.AAC.1